MDYTTIPQELIALNQWVWWRAEPRPDGKLQEAAISEQKSKTLLLNELIVAGFEARDTA